MIMPSPSGARMMFDPRDRRSQPRSSDGRAPGEGGYVLIWALFAFVLLGGLAAAALKTTGAERRLAKASSEWNASFYAAEVGLQQALGVATDTLVGALVPGDSMDLGWQPIDGSTAFRAVIYRIDNGSHLLYQIRSTGRHEKLFGGETTVTQTMTLASDKPDGILIDDPLRIEGTANIYGACRVHANDHLFVPGRLRTDGPVSSAGLSDGDIIIEGDDQGPESYADVIPPEPMDLASYCAAADYRVSGDQIVSLADGHSKSIGGSGASNWAITGDREYTMDAGGGGITSGSFCVDGSLTVMELGSPTAPALLSIFARGFVEMVGAPFVEAAHGDGTLILSYGDIVLDGLMDPSAPNFRGHLRARSECNTQGSIWIDGSLMCGGTTYSDPPGVRTIATENVIMGNLKLTTTCNINSIVAPRPIRLRSWRHDY